MEEFYPVHVQVHTGLGFFDHMLEQLSKHSRIDITCECEGDIQIDDHHTVEDCALTLGEAFDKYAHYMLLLFSCCAFALQGFRATQWHSEMGQCAVSTG
jgi:hypothetical protein